VYQELISVRSDYLQAVWDWTGNCFFGNLLTNWTDIDSLSSLLQAGMSSLSSPTIFLCCSCYLKALVS
jgi:hypothetical protein